jgi:Tat protein translocase TatB subunit
MDFLGMGFGEILLILLIALIFVGPHRIVGVSRSLGKLFYNIRKTTSDMTSQITKEIDEDTKSLKETASQISKEIQEQKKVVSSAAAELSAGIQKQGNEISNITSELKRNVLEQKQAVTNAAKELGESIKKPVSEIKAAATGLSQAVPELTQTVQEQQAATPNTVDTVVQSSETTPQPQPTVAEQQQVVPDATAEPSGSVKPVNKVSEADAILRQEVLEQMRSETEQEPAVVNAAVEPSENTEAPAPEEGDAKTTAPAANEPQTQELKTPTPISPVKSNEGYNVNEYDY